MITHPPQDVPPEVLFRLLTQTPRPSLPVTIRLAGEVGEAFCVQVRAVGGPQLHAARDDARLLVEELRPRRIAAALISLSVYDADARVFGAAADVDALDEDDFAALSRDVLRALGTISPVYGISDSAAWDSRLFAGCAHVTNTNAALALGGCVTEASSSHAVGPRLFHTISRRERPDLYYGQPLGLLTDGHWMAYRAAKRYVKSHEKGRG